jgi:UDP-N-acetylmuramoylalanine--D-glutamate ligase
MAEASGAKAEVRFIDDSKATNADAARASLMSFQDKSVIWIVGGLAKGGTFGDLVHEVRAKLACAVVIGRDQQPILDALHEEAPSLPRVEIDPDSPHVMEDSVERAMECVRERVRSNGSDNDIESYVVLLAPACASMDQFVSYADRGNQFQQAVQQWVGTHAR